MSKKFIFCFSGQGSQYYKMGKELYDQNQTFKSWMNRLDEIVRPIINESVISILYNDKAGVSDVFDRTIITHPAIFMFEYSLYCLLVKKNIHPDCVLGASLGEFTSAAVSSVLGYEDIMKMVVTQAKMIDNNCPKAGMMVFLYRLDYFNELKKQYPDIELSSINAENHFVISGSRASLLQIDKMLKNQNIIAQALPVSHAFHSKFIDSVSEQYLNYLKAFEYKKPSLPYMSCVTGTYIEESEIFKAGYFWDVCRKPILIKKTIETIENSGSFIYLDLGPSGTLANVIKQNIHASSGSKVQSIISPFGRDISNLNKVEDFIKEL